MTSAGLDEHLLGVVAVDGVNLAPLGEDRLTERQKCLAQRRGILPLSIHSLGRQPHNALVTRDRIPVATKACLEPVAAEGSTPICTRRGARVGQVASKTGRSPAGNAVGEGTVNDTFRCHPLPQVKRL